MVVGRIRQYKARQVSLYHLIKQGKVQLSTLVHVHVRVCGMQLHCTCTCRHRITMMSYDVICCLNPNLVNVDSGLGAQVA